MSTLCMKSDMVRRLAVGLRCLNATFNNMSVISWQSVLFVEETGENLPQVTDKLYRIIMYRVYFSMSEAGFEPTILVLMGTGCKANCHTTTTPLSAVSPTAQPFVGRDRLRTVTRQNCPTMSITSHFSSMDPS